MKKILSLVLALALSVSLFTACGSKPEQPAATEAAITVDGTMEELLNKIVAENPVEFMGGVIPIDLTDTSEDGLWAIKSYTGLEDASSITEAAVFEPMMGSMAFSMVMVRVDIAHTSKQVVAEAMKSGIDTRKWICVEANDLLVTGYGDVVMLIMLDNQSGLTAQSFVDAFAKVVGTPEFTI